MFGPVINFLVKVVAPIAVTVVSAIVAQGNNFIANAVNTVAGWFGGGSGSSSHSSGGSSSNRGGSSVISFEEQRRLAVQQRQQRQSLERDISYSLAQSEPEEEPPLDFADLLLPTLVPAEIMLAAWGNPVAESMVIMMRNEPDLLRAMINAAASPEEGLRNLFAEAGRSEEDDAQAVQMYQFLTETVGSMTFVDEDIEAASELPRPPLLASFGPPTQAARVAAIREYALDLIDFKREHPEFTEAEYLRLVMQYSFSFPGTTISQWGNDISEAIAQGRGDELYGSYLSSTPGLTDEQRIPLDGSGFHSDYQQGLNYNPDRESSGELPDAQDQTLHFWAALNTTLQHPDISGQFIPTAASFAHDWLGVWESAAGASIEDDHLTRLGRDLGMELGTNRAYYDAHPDEAIELIMNAISSPSPYPQAFPPNYMLPSRVYPEGGTDLGRAVFQGLDIILNAAIGRPPSEPPNHFVRLGKSLIVTSIATAGNLGRAIFTPNPLIFGEGLSQRMGDIGEEIGSKLATLAATPVAFVLDTMAPQVEDGVDYFQNQQQQALATSIEYGRNEFNAYAEHIRIAPISYQEAEDIVSVIRTNRSLNPASDNGVVDSVDDIFPMSETTPPHLVEAAEFFLSHRDQIINDSFGR